MGGRLNILKMTDLPNLSFRLHIIQIPASDFENVHKPILKFIWGTIDPEWPSWVGQKNKAEGQAPPDLQTDHKATEVKAAWDCETVHK